MPTRDGSGVPTGVLSRFIIPPVADDVLPCDTIRRDIAAVGHSPVSTTDICLCFTLQNYQFVGFLQPKLHDTTKNSSIRE